MRIASRAVEALRRIDGVAGAAPRPPGWCADGVVATRGDTERVYRWASITKLVTALAVLVAAEEGVVDLDEPAGPEGSTVRHLLAHASGLPFESGGAAIGRPGARRIYPPRGSRRWPSTSRPRPRCRSRTTCAAAVLEPLGDESDAELRESRGGQACGGRWTTCSGWGASYWRLR